MYPDIEGAHQRGCQRAESRMLDTCVVEFESGETAQNEETGRIEPIWTSRFESICRVPPNRSGDDFEAGATSRSKAPREVHIPADSPRVFLGDRVRILTVDPTSDPQLVGSTFRVVNPAFSAQTTARRMQVEEEL